MSKIVISSAVRTPIGSLGGALSSLLPIHLATTAVREAVKQAKIGGTDVGYTSMGWVMQDPRSPNIAKTAAEKAGVPHTSPGTTVHENCASGAAAIHDACRRLLLGEVEIAVAGGVESMSNVARYLFPGRTKGQVLGDFTLVDGLLLGLTDSNVGKGELMGLLTERLADKYGVTREEQDRLAHRSHVNARAAWKGGFFDYVVPVSVKNSKGAETVVSADEGPRDVELAYFSAQKPYFKPNGGTITSANSSTLNDAAAALVLTTEAVARRRGMPILATIEAFTNVGVPAELMGEGAFAVIPKLLQKADRQIAQVDFFELNEAFAVVVGAALKATQGLSEDKVNVWGSGISLGHPVGCTGARQVTDMVHQLRKRGKKVGVTTRCVGGGMGSGEVIVIN